MNKFLILIIILIVLILSIVYKKKKVVIHKQDTHISEIKGSTPFKANLDPTWLPYPPVRNKLIDKSFYADVINHTNSDHVWKDRSTTAHELTHGINNEISSRSSYFNGFYIGENKAIRFAEPKTTLSRASEFIPKSLQGGRYNTYLVSQRKYWEKQPLYIFDEWVAYRNGTLVAIEDVQAGNLKEHTDEAFSCLEFSVYALAVFRAIEADDPNWLKENPDFVKFMRFYLKKSIETYKIGQGHPNLNWGSDYLKVLQSNAIFKDLAKRLTGEDLFDIKVNAPVIEKGKLYQKILERYKRVYIVFFYKGPE